MIAKKLRLLLLACGTCCAGFVHAGSGDITGRDAEGSVELSNLDDQEAPVVVAAPAGKTVEAPDARTAGVAPSRSLAKRPATKKSRSVADQEEDDEVAASSPEDAVAAASERGTEPGGQGVASADRLAAQAYASGIASGSVGGVATGAAPGAGAPVSGGTPVESPASGGTGSLPGSPWQGGSQGGTGGQMASVLDSPELLAQRLAQYRDLMLNEPRPNGGLVANPAVQRRYLMINRSGYMGTYR